MEISKSQFGNYRKIISISITCISSWIFCYLSIEVFKDYSFGLFLLLPTAMGTLSTIVYAYKNNVNKKALRNHSFMTLGIFISGLLLFAWEGAICLAMAAPLGILFNYIGYRIGYLIIKNKVNRNIPITVVLIMISVPGFMAFESLVEVRENLRGVTSSIEIAATPEKVWRNVIEFSQIKEPTEIIFNTGIAYPISARIEGKGPGAIRYCNFTTGCFIEPITVWNEPQLLKFNVLDQPEPMKEFSFYNIHPNHLHGYWVSKQGQFRLIRLANGKTLLEGTTWYVNKIKPNIYWSLWSDYIVHKIHQRALRHIKSLSESDMQGSRFYPNEHFSK